MGTFPFGWIRDSGQENWQLLWDSETKVIYAKSAVSKKVINIGQSQSWQETKVFADKLQDTPGAFLELSQGKIE